ncbi:hypothetical protein [Pleomorphovibrio marinus]|uniref:hypothetical protein n=1 Tax=Pleomorphovibrio marinus TaxID=2164132 RepID=UPI000E0C9E83|nr:hypothetical protein [Pleomorphovibrio marinus]
MIKKITLLFLWVLVSCTSTSDPVSNPKQGFFDQLSLLCGQSFPGYIAFPEGSDAQLRMEIQSCNDTEIRIPFQIDENKSRTWVIQISEKGLLLKHDHRKEDGSLDERTDYGGWAHDAGSVEQQFFLADAYTGKLIPEGISNQWYMQVNKEKKEFVYYLERETGPRFKAVFDLSQAVWGEKP